MAKTKPGDVFSIDVEGKYAFFQCMQDVPQWGTMIRVLPGTFEEQPQSLVPLALQLERFITFFPVEFARKRRIVDFVENAPLPATATRFPTFRAPGLSDRDGRVMKWFLWDGNKTWPADSTKPGFWELPIQEVWNDTLLIERIRENWVPSKDR